MRIHLQKTFDHDFTIVLSFRNRAPYPQNAIAFFEGSRALFLLLSLSAKPKILNFSPARSRRPRALVPWAPPTPTWGWVMRLPRADSSPLESNLRNLIFGTPKTCFSVDTLVTVSPHPHHTLTTVSPHPRDTSVFLHIMPP